MSALDGVRHQQTSWYTLFSIRVCNLARIERPKHLRIKARSSASGVRNTSNGDTSICVKHVVSKKKLARGREECQ
jgi:hypothetical protein